MSGTARMLVSLTGINITFLTLIWSMTLSCVGLSFGLCFMSVLRRYRRNREMALRAEKRNAFKAYISEALRLGPEKASSLNDAPACDTPEIAAVLLHYFRTLKGHTKQHLQELISSSHVEEVLVEGTFTGIRGTRMRAVRTLSYLRTQKSLQVIFSNLSSEDKYVRLTAARCLVRRDGICYLNGIIDSLIEAFPEDYKLIAGVLEGIGRDGITSLEHVIKGTKNSVVKTAALETLILLGPEKTSLKFDEMMLDTVASVRSATLALSVVVNHDSEIDPLKAGLSDEAISVKIRAAKIACDVKRSDVISDLYKLTKDPVMWVRYWAFRAIWVSGASGQKFVASRSALEPMAANVALEMRSGYV